MTSSATMVVKSTTVWDLEERLHQLWVGLGTKKVFMKLLRRVIKNWVKLTKF